MKPPGSVSEGSSRYRPLDHGTVQLENQVDALIQAAGQGNRLGLGPKAFVMLDGRTLLEHAVAAVSPFATRILIAISADDQHRAESRVSDSRIRWIMGGESRSETTRRLLDAASAPWILLHDVVHPLASATLIADVIASAFQHGAAAPMIRNTAFLYGPEGESLHAPGEVMMGQKPVAFSRAFALAGFNAADSSQLGSDPSLLQVLQLGGVRTTFVVGDSSNIKITTPGDLVLAAALLSVKHS